MNPKAALANIWELGGGDPEALGQIALTGDEPVMPSSYKVGTIAQATIAGSALAAAEVHRSRTGVRQTVGVDMRHAAVEFKSERVYELDGKPPPAVWAAVSGTYQTGDGRWVRLHANFPHHRAGLLGVLGAQETRDSVAAKLAGWRGQDFEDTVAERGLCATMMRSPEEWAAHPQAAAVATLPLFEIIKIGEAPPRPRAKAERPLSGVRVLDLTRVLAGPVCGRTLAAHGADVLRVTGPHLPDIPTLDIDTGRGKLSTHIDLRDEAGRAILNRLAESADIFVQGYRPGGIADRGFSPEAVAAKRPGIVYVSLCAYSHVGPWATRRGFDSLVQTATGINHAEAQAIGVTHPHELPCQALDHGAGYLMATGAMMALKRQSEIGGSWLVRTSLAQVGHWLTGLGRVPGGHAARDINRADVLDLMDTSQSGRGPFSALRHAAHMSATPTRWVRPSALLGSHMAEWPTT